MSPTNPNPLGMWRQFKHRFLTSQDGSSFDLPNLSDEILRDIGLSRGAEQFKPAMPFWVPRRFPIPARHSITSSAMEGNSREIVRRRDRIKRRVSGPL